MICLSCKNKINLPSNSCRNCNQKLIIDDDIYDFFFRDEKYEEYSKNYNDEAIYDLKDGAYSDRYLLNQALNLINFSKKYINNDSKILDVGVGRGFLVRELLSRFNTCEFYGVDIAKPYLNNLGSHKNLFKIFANAENLPFENEIDIIYLSDVAEHVINFGNLVYSVNKSLKRGGKLIIKVPLENYLANQLNHADRNYSRKQNHLRAFDKYILYTNLNAGGFKCHDYRYDGYSIFMPKKIISKNYYLTRIFNEKYQPAMRKKFQYIEDITLIENKIYTLPLQANEIIVIATKK